LTLPTLARDSVDTVTRHKLEKRYQTSFFEDENNNNKKKKKNKITSKRKSEELSCDLRSQEDHPSELRRNNWYI
jgi:hypothetical protein